MLEGFVYCRLSTVGRAWVGPIWMTKTKHVEDPAGEAILIEETGFGPFQLKVTTGSSTFVLDEPFGGAGGLGSGPNPYDLLSAALGASTITTIRTYATTRRWRLETVNVRVVCNRSANRGRGSFLRQILLLGILDEPQRSKLLVMADRCPIQLLIGRGPEITTELLAEHFPDAVAVNHGEHLRDVMAACEREA
jgi:putative redox protein